MPGDCLACEAMRKMDPLLAWPLVAPSGLTPEWPEIQPQREKLFCKFCGGRLVPDPSFPAHAQMYDEYTGERIKPPKICLNGRCNRGITF